MGRSHKATNDGYQRAKDALKIKGWSQEYLAGKADCTRQIVGNFFARRAVEKRLFRDICSALSLEWGEIAELEQEEQVEQPTRNDCATSNVENKTIKSIGTEVSNDHRYDGLLVTLSLKFYKILSSEQVRIITCISFGKKELKIPSQVNSVDEITDIEFGIKKGNLHLALSNGVMPLDQRKVIRDQVTNCTGNPIGNESSIWQFELIDKLNYQPNSKVLSGYVENQEMGTINLLDSSANCEITATFKININRNYIEVTYIDNEMNNKQRETKVGLLLRHLENELEKYVSEVKYEV